MTESLTQTAARLAAGSQGRTEADIQSDVRKFLLDAPLDLGDQELVDVALEAQAGGGRRIDVEAGCAAIEVKKSLASQTVFEAATGQLGGYVKQRTEERGQRYVGVLTDGKTWVLFHLEPGGGLVEVTRLQLRGGEDADQLASWLEAVLATTDKIVPSPKEITRRLAYLVLTAELLAHEVMGIEVDDPGADVRALLEGQQFELAGLHGVVEADFFDWPAVTLDGHPIIKGIARRLSRFDWAEVEHDVLKTLYESVIDTETRHKLGEYYTPDWLAERIVDETFNDPLEQRLLDPACGSGTFLFWAVRRLLAACDDAGISNRQALERVVRQVQGLDLHPVAVTLARVTYLLALSPERLADRGELTIPVFLGDSVRWEQDDTLLTEGGITVHTSDGLELFAQELHFPEGAVEDPARFDRLVAVLADKAAARKTSAIPGIGGILNAHHVVGKADRAAVELVFSKLCRLHDAGRDHVWSYYVRNLARPLSFTRPDGRADVLVGNPPWLAYRHMPEKLQQTYRALAEQRGLWAGGKVATHQDLSDLFVARAVEQYLKPGGSFSFVMPYAVLSRRQFAGFRTGRWMGPGVGSQAALQQAEEFARVKPPLFPMPSCVISGEKAQSAAALPGTATTWTGRVTSHHVDWATAAQHLTQTLGDVTTASDRDESPYRTRFSQGATFVPRMLITVELVSAGPLGVAAGRIPVRSARSANEKLPWKALPPLEGVVENQFITSMHLGATIVAFRARTPALAVVPYVDGELLDGSSERLDEFPGLAAWWRDAERLWNSKRGTGSNLTLLERQDFHRGLRRQFPLADHRVVYTKSGQHLAACRIDDAEAVIDHKLYWAAVDSPDEGQYLCAILNSQALADAVVGLQARGQHNPRDFDKHVFALPFPAFDATDELHLRLASLAERAEEVTAAVTLDDTWQFQKARRVTREALRQDGVAGVIDDAVADLLEAPDVLAAISEPVSIGA